MKRSDALFELYEVEFLLESITNKDNTPEKIQIILDGIEAPLLDETEDKVVIYAFLKEFFEKKKMILLKKLSLDINSRDT